jgi:hypothetical protein
MSNPYPYPDAAMYGGGYADDDPYDNDDDDDDDNAAASASGATAAGAGGVLALGSSVSVNADLHRSVRQEIAELDELCRKAKSGLDAEARTAKELMAAHRHADAEMTGLRASGARTLDSVHVGEQILRELKGTILQPFLDSSNNHSGRAESHGKQQLHGGGGGGHTGHKTPMDHLAHVSAESWAAQKAHRDRISERRKEQHELRAKALQLVELMKEVREVEKTADDRTPGLDRQIAELRARQEQAEQVLAREDQRLWSLEAATQDAEAALVEARQTKAAKVRFPVNDSERRGFRHPTVSHELPSTVRPPHHPQTQVSEHEAHQASNQQMRNETEGRLEGARSRTADLDRQLAEVRAERAHWDGKGEAAEKHLGEVQALLDARTARREAAEAIQAERAEADAAKTTLEAGVATLQSELDLQNQILAKEQDKAETIQKQVQATDALHAERCSAALKEELAEMIQHVHDTERLAKELREGSDPSQEQLEEDLAATQELVAKCKASAEAALDELRGQKARVDDARSALDQRRASLARLHELRSHTAQLEEEVAALKRSVDERNRLAEARDEKRFQLRVYREAVKLLQDTAAKEEQALAVTAVPPPSAENESAGERLQISEPSDPPGGGGGDPKDSQDPQPLVRLRMW